METWGSIRISNTLQRWIDNGEYAENIKDGFVFNVGCGRFRSEKCTCTKCRSGLGNRLTKVLEKNGLI